MNIEERWQKAIRKTEIFRSRLKSLHTFQETDLPYVYLAESIVNPGDVVVRKGKVVVERPLVVLPGNIPQFEGFEFDKEFHLGDEGMSTFFLMRGISFPTLKYCNETHRLEIVPGFLSRVLEEHKRQLERKEDIKTGLVISPEDCWQFAILIYVAALVAKSVPEDIRNILKRMKLEGE